MRKPAWTSTAILASLVALVAVSVSQTSHAAADTCLSAPNGAAPKGQHWYYKLVRKTQQKCWYLRETITRPAATAAAPSARAGKSTRPAAPVETVRSTGGAATSPPQQRYTSAQPSGAPSVESNTSRIDQAAAAITAAASAPANTKTAASFQPAREPTAASAATVWPDPPLTPVGVQESNAAWGGPGAPAIVSNTSDTRVATNQAAVAQHDAKLVTANANPVSAAASNNQSTNTFAQDLLIIALASALAAAASVAIAALRRRKRATAAFVVPAASQGATISAYFAVLRRQLVKSIPADYLPRPGWSRLQSRRAGSPQSATIQASLVPEQMTMPRPLVAPRWQERVDRDRRAHVEWRAPDSDP